MTNRTTLTSEEKIRYDRHLRLPEIGLEGQLALRNSKVLLIGCGGLGAPASLYLAAAGVGSLGLLDFDRVEASNLQRQVLFQHDQIGRSKAECAAERLRALNPGVAVQVYDERLHRGNALELIADYDLVLDGSDNFETRYVANDACSILGRPNVHASVFRFQGQVAIFDTAQGSACYRCLFPDLPPAELTPSCAEGGVLGVLPGVVGSLQATEALKLLLNKGRPLTGRLLVLDLLNARFREMAIPKDPTCRLCGGESPVADLEDPRLTEHPAFRVCCDLELTSEELRARIDSKEAWLVVDVRDLSEWEAGRLATLDPMHLPLDRILQGQAELPTDRPLLLYCRSGERSRRAVAHLRSSGYHRAWSLHGGLSAWSGAA